MAQLGGCNNNPTVGVNDAVCVTFELGDTGEDSVPVWQDTTPYVMNGTIVIENNGIAGIAPTIGLMVNGTAVPDFEVGPGDARAITMDNIDSIAITATGGTGTGIVKVSFSLNYKFW